ncbi:MAG: alpha/beta hydrolase [Acidimicrobiales bacterium]
MQGTRYTVSGAGGVELMVLSAGKGPPLLLVHGGVGQIEGWAPVWDLLESERRVIAMDRRGRGSSGDAGTYRIEDEYEDVFAVASALAEEAEGPIDVFGHSFGGTCAIGAAARGAPFGRIAVYEPPGKESVTPDFVDRLFVAVAEGTPGRAMVSFLTENIGLSISEVDNLRATPPAYDILKVLSDTLPREGKALLNVDVPALASNITAPVLFLLGERSPIWAKDITHRAAAAIANSKVTLLPGLGHMAIDSDPQRVVDELNSFLAEDPAR